MMLQENNFQKDISILELMTLKITKYFHQSIYISDLIYELESYLNQLTVVDEEWKTSFRTTWLDIEVAYSLALDKGLDKPTNDGDAIVVSSLNVLNKMAKDKIKKLKNELQDQ